MALPPLDIEAATGAATGDLSPPVTPEFTEPPAKAKGDQSAARVQSLRVGTNLRQGFVSQKNRRFDLGGGLIVSESIAEGHDRQGFYLHASYYPHVGYERYRDLKDPANFIFVPTVMDAFPRIRFGLHGSVDVLSFDTFEDRGMTIAGSAELVRGNHRARTPGCIARFGYSGEESIGLKLTGGVRQLDGARYWLATVGLTVRLPAVGGVVAVPVLCGDDNE